MTSCCPPPRMPWSGATGAIARGTRVSTGCGRTSRSVRAWRWTCGVKPTPKAGNKPSPPFIVHGLDKPGGFTTVSTNKGKSMIIKNRLAGTRITVWDVLHYLETGWSCPEIAETLPLSKAQVEAVARYIEDHREELMVVQQQIEARKARGNPPEIQDKLAKSRMKLQAWLKQHHKTNT